MSANHDLIITQPSQIISNYDLQQTPYLDTSSGVDIYFKNLSTGAHFMNGTLTTD